MKSHCTTEKKKMERTKSMIMYVVCSSTKISFSINYKLLFLIRNITFQCLSHYSCINVYDYDQKTCIRT